ncbi:MAG: substrate-binding domain-containing protein [Gloeomargarita sp. SKYBB_i_bin120]|nr:substrate-binding domain-containing protein [Gloeomargarita sp. SKYG98]MCS7292186.1 substrate-binding domain-containing protein [Gloeomargarita sp. SKYB120]MDW8177747.1 substrate-binding domain-containing protein [Gloeomargarita sp. SKYBB_i_bin120]
MTPRLPNQKQLRRRTLLSLGILAAGLILTWAPLPGVSQTLVVVAGTELRQVLEVLRPRFEQQQPNIRLELHFQGSQELANNYLDDTFAGFHPTILIPANQEILEKLVQDWRARENTEPFLSKPQPIASTFMVGIAWPERGRVLFPQGRFDWERVAQALRARQWAAMGGPAAWGSFDFRMTDPLRSNSGQLTLALWSQQVLGQPLTPSNVNSPPVIELLRLLKPSVYRPPRSTDLLLEEFISQGPNEGDVAVVYESIALSRWPQAQVAQGQGYRIYYFSPTVATVSTAVVVRRRVSPLLARAAETFIAFLRAPEQQQVFVQQGFRPVIQLAVEQVPGSPWAQGIPGVQATPPVQQLPMPQSAVLAELQKQWQRF